ILCGSQLEQAAEVEATLLLVCDAAELLERLVAIVARRMLQAGDRQRAPVVVLPLVAVGILAPRLKPQERCGGSESQAVTLQRLLRDLLQADAANAGSRAGEVAIHHLAS